MNKKASFIFTFDSKTKAEIIAAAISPELKIKIPKAKVLLSVKNNTLNLSIESNDVNSLRAASNSFLRWINTAVNVNYIV